MKTSQGPLGRTQALATEMIEQAVPGSCLPPAPSLAPWNYYLGMVYRQTRDMVQTHGSDSCWGGSVIMSLAFFPKPVAFTIAKQDEMKARKRPEGGAMGSRVLGDGIGVPLFHQPASCFWHSVSQNQTSTANGASPCSLSFLLAAVLLGGSSWKLPQEVILPSSALLGSV